MTMTQNRSDILATVRSRLAASLLGARSTNVLLAGPWGSGKTTLLGHLVEQPEIRDHFVLLTYSPWETLGTSEPRAGFLRYFSAVLEQAESQASAHDDGVVEKLKASAKTIAKACQPLAAKAVEAALTGGAPVPFLRALLSPEVIETLWTTWVPSEEGPEPVSEIRKARAALRKMLGALAAVQGKRAVLLLLDDMDRCRPSEAIALMDGLYHLLAPQEELLEPEAPWPLSCVWAVNVPVLEEFLHEQFRSVPSFAPEAYLEKMFDRRVSLPPLTSLGEAESFWAEELLRRKEELASSGQLDEWVETTCEEIGKEVARLVKALDYSILGNLRLHRHVIRSCLDYWLPFREAGRESVSRSRFSRQARLLLLSRAFPGFRETVVIRPEHWFRFLGLANGEQQSSDGGVAIRHAGDACLLTLLSDLGAIEHVKGQWRLVDERATALRAEMLELMTAGH
ncbi:MAG: P-loop NTPase fold protein [Acidobacteriota bacterium]